MRNVTLIYHLTKILPKRGIFFKHIIAIKDKMKVITNEIIMRNSLITMKFNKLYLERTNIKIICIKYIPNEQLEIFNIKLLSLLTLIDFRELKIKTAAIGCKKKSYQTRYILVVLIHICASVIKAIDTKIKNIAVQFDNLSKYCP